MKYVLNVVYVSLFVLLAPWMAWTAIRKGKYREGWLAKFGGYLPRLGEPAGRRIWFHAVSVGEVNLLCTLVPELQESWPQMDVVITTTTKTGYELATRRFPDHVVSYCPLDFSWAVKNAIRRIQPDLLVLVELELWPNLLMAAKEHAIPVGIVNARLSESSAAGYRRLRKWLPGSTTRVFGCIDMVAAQSSSCADRFVSLGIPRERIHLTGSMKFDGAKTDRRNALSLRLRALANIQPDEIVFVAGSTQSPEEAYAISAFTLLASQYPQLRLILVPRHPERSEEVANLLAENSEHAWCRRSEVSDEQPMESQRILLVDVIGELAGWWGCADIGFVGGSMGKRGGQNMLEPSGYGVATCFGPKTRNFRDVVSLLLQADAACVVEDGKSLHAFVEKCLNDKGFRFELGQRAQRVVISQRGATHQTVSLVRQLAGEQGKNAWRKSA